MNAYEPQLRDWRDIARIVREWLVKTDRTQEDLAQLIGHKSSAELSRMMNGKKDWYLPTLHRVSEIIGADPRQFYHWPTNADSFLRGRDAAMAIFERKIEEAIAEIMALEYVNVDENDEPVRPSRRQRSPGGRAGNDR